MDAGIVPPLVHLLATAEFDIKKESAWAVSNATSGGTADQIKYLVHQVGAPAAFLSFCLLFVSFLLAAALSCWDRGARGVLPAGLAAAPSHPPTPHTHTH